MAGPYYVKSGGGTIGAGTYRGIWVALSTWAVGDRVVVTRSYGTAAARGFIFECTTGGVGGASEPGTWVITTPGTSTTTDGTATFTCRDCITWANANVFTDYMEANRIAAGERLFISNNSSESIAAALTIVSPGTLASPCQVLSANDGAEPPTALTTTSVLTTTGASSLVLQGSIYKYGVTFNVGTGGGTASLTLNNSASLSDSQRYVNCAFNLVGTSASALISVIGNVAIDTGNVTWENCTASFGATGQSIKNGTGTFLWKGGSITGATIPTSLIKASTSTRSTDILISGVDLSPIGSAKNLVDVTGFAQGIIRFTNCKLGSSVAFTTGTWGADGPKVIFENCSSTNTNYTFYYEDYTGSTREETTIVKTGGGSDGTTAWSMKMTSSANAKYPLLSLESPVLPAKWNTTLTAITVTVDIIHDSITTLNDDEVWLEVEYLGTSGFPQSVFVSDAKANVLATAAAQTASSATWTTTGLTNPNKQKLNVTFTPAKEGYLLAKVKLAKSSYAVYVDPVLQIS